MKIAKLASLMVAVPDAGAAQAAEPPTGTLKKIKDTGVITLGVRDSSIPFNYNLGGVRQVGYSYDINMKIVEAIKDQLDAEPAGEGNPDHPQNRITLLQNGTIDIECGSTTNNLERQKQVSFTDSIFIIGTRIMVKKDGGIKDWADLKGKNVRTTAGTTSERLLRKMNDDQKLGMNIISTKDHGQSVPDAGIRPCGSVHDGRRAAVRRARQGQEPGGLDRRGQAAIARGLRPA
ncbi:transporter substrate-binding domain-containing protein [Cupriavidus basilensis]